MGAENAIYTWPRADNQTLLLLIAGVVLVFVLAILAEWWRRKKARQALHNAEWAAAGEIAHERDLTPAEWELLKKLIARHAPESPHKVCTMRHYFNHLVEESLRGDLLGPEGPALEERGLHLRDIRDRLGLNYIPMGQQIGSTRELYSGQELWAGADKKTSEWFLLTVVEVNEAVFYAMPKTVGAALPFEENSEVVFRMWRKEDARYEFECTLLRDRRDKGGYVFVHTTDLYRVQAREYVRLTINQPVSVSVVSAGVDGNLDDVRTRDIVTRFRGRLTSLSGGGMAILAQQSVPRQVLLLTPIALDAESGVIDTVARLVESVSLPGGEYLLRCAFVDLSPEEQEHITRYIFQRQKRAAQVDAPAGENLA